MSRKDMPSYVPRLNDLLGKEPILRGEDRDAHKSLQAAIQDALSPDDIFEEIAAREITSAIWEAQLYRKMKKKFVELQYPRAVENLVSDGESDDHEGLTQAEILKKSGDLIQAFAMISVQEDLPFFERLIEGRAAARRALLKDFERRRRGRAKRDRSGDK